MDAPAHILASLVIDASVAKVIVAELVAVELRFVGQDIGFAVHILLHDRDDVFGAGMVNHEGAALAAFTMN
jgi:hypothetical protein